jgi:hypothetical protein
MVYAIWAHNLLKLDFDFISKEGTLAVGIGTLLVSLASAASTIWLGWRNDGRQTREFGLKIQQLELQLEEAQKAKIQPPSLGEKR